MKRARMARQTGDAMPELQRLPTYLRREAPISAFDREKLTFEFTMSTGAPVVRTDFWTGEQWVERLEISKKAIDLTRLKDGAPIVDSHRMWSIDDVLGTHEDAWLDGDGEGARLKGRGRLSSAPTEKLGRVRHDVADGILRHTSVGYRIQGWRIKKADPKAGTLEERTAIAWFPHENSIVALGADPGAGIGRSADQDQMQAVCGYFARGDDGLMTFVRDVDRADLEQPRTDAAGQSTCGAERRETQETQMPPEANTQDPQQRAQVPAPAPAPAQPQVDEKAIRAAETQRVLQIQEAARTLGFEDGDGEVRKLIDDGLDIEKASRALIERVALKQPKIQGAHSGRVTVGEEQYGRMLGGAEQALAARMGCTGIKTDEGPAREMRNLPLLDMARELLIEKGALTRSESRMLTKHELVKRAVHGTSDFPKITSNAANKRLQQAYMVQPRTFAGVVNVVDVPDFKQVSVAHLGGISALEEVGEHGEFHYATIGEKAETYVASTWGKIVALSRQLIINDDLRAFANMTSKLGRAASVLENNLHWALRTGNKVMSDGNGVYHSAHGNIGTKVLGLDGLAEGFRTMLVQRDLAPKAGELGDYINVTPSILTVPPELLHLALQLTADLTPGVVTAANPYRGKLKVEVEPRLSAAGVTNGTTTWFLDAAPSDWPTWELAYLEGARGPVVESREGFEVDGVEIKVRHDVAMAAIDWVGTFRSNGTVA